MNIQWHRISTQCVRRDAACCFFNRILYAYSAGILGSVAEISIWSSAYSFVRKFVGCTVQSAFRSHMREKHVIGIKFEEFFYSNIRSSIAPFEIGRASVRINWSRFVILNSPCVTANDIQNRFVIEAHHMVSVSHLISSLLQHWRA